MIKNQGHNKAIKIKVKMMMIQMITMIKMMPSYR